MESVNSWIAFFSVKEDLLEGNKSGQAYSAVGGRFMALGPDPSGVSRVVLMGIHPRGDDTAMRPFREAMDEGDDTLMRFIARHYEGAGWKTGEVMGKIAEWEDFYANETVQIKVPCVYKGRFALAGDAGYAPGPTGAGTTLTLAGAYILAGEVSKHKGDLAAALRGYEQQMRPLITEFQKIPPLVPTVLAPKTAWGLCLRNNIFAFVIWSGLLHLVGKFAAASFDSSEKYAVPEYEWVA
jgi:2-polyprenyl-6-methoxyphenol hydroxylase-like FAD-dependent oxidoreductase